MSYKTDMHLHTYYSDGILSPAEIVKRAKKLGYDIVAITDHDGTGGVGEALAAAEAIGDIEVIPGIELSADERFLDATVNLHILGYRINIDNAPLSDELAAIRARRDVRNGKLTEALRLMGYDIDLAELNANKKGYIGKPDIARYMAEKGYIKSAKEAFQPGRFLESPEIKAIRKEKLGAARAIELITGAGGIAVLAHPAKIKKIGERGGTEFYGNLDVLIGRLKGYGLKGVECYHTEHSEDEAMRLVELAEKYHLHITEGSDFHGE